MARIIDPAESSFRVFDFENRMWNDEARPRIRGRVITWPSQKPMNHAELLSSLVESPVELQALEQAVLAFLRTLVEGGAVSGTSDDPLRSTLGLAMGAVSPAIKA